MDALTELTEISAGLSECNARPLGPYVSPPPHASIIGAAFTAPHDPPAAKHPIVRSRFDQFNDPLPLAPLYTSPVRYSSLPTVSLTVHPPCVASTRSTHRRGKEVGSVRAVGDGPRDYWQGGCMHMVWGIIYLAVIPF